MIKYFLVFCFSFLLLQSTFAQCEGFTPPTSFNAIYSHCSDQIPGKCAQFSATENFFFYYHKVNKTGVSIDLPPNKESCDLAYLVSLTNNKKLKLKAVDMLLLQEALVTWYSKKSEIQITRITNEKFTAEQLGGFEFTREPSGLGIHFLEKVEGPLPVKGKKVTVHYRGYLANGEVFDASYDRGTAFEFPLGMNRVIKGWEEGIAKIPIGSRALLRIPPEMGYGGRATGSIPANSVLIFDVLLLGQ
ncbi:FKBP-type peptidyl-prolyl cis-trans isomerase [bacterium]|nr:FKBP-type peptidyl-prolyl cis-trans isomerase [bacterium]